MRRVTLMGRLGTVLLMTGLALGLVSLIPSAQMGSYIGSMSSVSPEKYEILYLPFSPLTPQSGIHISVESNSSFNVYLLGIFLSQFQDWTASWVREQFPNLQEYEFWSASHNMTVLNAFLESHPDTVLWKSDRTSKVSKEFFPDMVSNVTSIIANPSLSLVQYECEIRAITSLAPKERILLSAELLVPIGIVLAIPWTYFTKIRKTHME